MDRIGYVYFENNYAGQLREADEGYYFTYDPSYLETGTPLGFNFPFSQLKFYSGEFFPLFENLVSEGWILELQSTIQHIDESDKFGILLNNGRDLVGALTVLKEKR